MTVSTYDDIAEWYRELFCVEPVTEDPFYPAVQELVGDVAGLWVCDLACGEGRVSRHLADLGARVVGVDVSSRLLTMAGEHERTEPRGVGYLRDDARGLAAVRDCVFHGVVCNMALMDIPDLVPTVRAIARVLRPCGWFVFSILHPCYHTARSGESSPTAQPNNRAGTSPRAACSAGVSMRRRRTRATPIPTTKTNISGMTPRSDAGWDESRAGRPERWGAPRRTRGQLN